MKYRKLYERIVDDLVADGLIAEPTADGIPAAPVPDWDWVSKAAAGARADLEFASSVLTRVYALCYEDAPVALSIVSQVAREYGVKLDTAPGPVVRWQCEGCTFATADVERMSGHYRATGHLNRRADKSIPRTGALWVCGAPCPFETGSAALAGDHQNETGHAMQTVPTWAQARDDARTDALRKVLDVLTGWITAVMENDEAMDRRDRPDAEHVVLHAEDVRRMVADAARELGVTL